MISVHISTSDFISNMFRLPRALPIRQPNPHSYPPNSIAYLNDKWTWKMRELARRQREKEDADAERRFLLSERTARERLEARIQKAANRGLTNGSTTPSINTIPVVSDALTNLSGAPVVWEDPVEENPSSLTARPLATRRAKKFPRDANKENYYPRAAYLHD